MGILSEMKKNTVGSTELVRNLSKYIDELADGTRDKLVIVRNNKPDAVLISVEMMEKIENALEGANLDIAV